MSISEALMRLSESSEKKVPEKRGYRKAIQLLLIALKETLIQRI